MFVLYKDSFDYGEWEEREMIACADSIEKLVAHYEELEGHKINEIKFDKGGYGYCAYWLILEDSKKCFQYGIQEVKAL